MNLFKKAFNLLQQLGKALMLPVSVLPVAGILLGVGSSKFSWIPASLPTGVNIFKVLPLLTAIGVTILKTMAESGNVIFANLPLIFAIGVALGLTKNDGVSALAAVVGYMVMNATMGVVADIRGLDHMFYCDACNHVINEQSTIVTSQIMGIHSLDTGVFGGILIGMIAGWLFNKYYRISLPPYLGFFAGKRFVPIVTAFAAIIAGIVLCFIWPPIGRIINTAGNWAANNNPLLAGTVYGTVERALLPFGLHHIWNAPFFFQMGSFTASDGTVYHGDITRFFHGDPTAGILDGGFLFKMWGLPAAAIAIWHCAKPENKVRVGGLMISAALTSFLTGITEPIEFSFMFVAPLLYVVHALLVGCAYFIMNFDIPGGIPYLGFTFSQGGIDYLLYFRQGTNPISVLWLGPIFALIYYTVFRVVITKLDLKTPGREDSSAAAAAGSGEGSELAGKVLAALGGQQNIVSLDACITRLRVGLKDIKAAAPETLKALGAAGVVTVGNSLQAIFGTLSENLKSDIEDYIQNHGGAAQPLQSAAAQEQPEAVEVSSEIRQKAEKLIPFLGGRANLSDIHASALTRIVFKTADPQKVQKEAVKELGLGILALSGGKFHLLGSLEEVPALAKALNELK
ncbi:PTS transporter subunit EIIC [bacterium]|nr:PTS transporter subunit EIIC [bacterium]